MPAAPWSLLGDNDEVDPAAVQVVVAVAVAIVAVVGAAVAVKVVAAAAATVVVVAIVVVAAAGFAGRVVVAPPTLRGYVRSNCCWPSAQLKDGAVEPRGERVQSDE